MNEYVKVSSKNGIAEIEFFHSQSNSLPSSLLSKLADTIKSVGNDKNSNVIILKSGGDRTFCAGASFDELISIKNKDDGKRFFMGFANVINACRQCPKFIIGRVQGKAVGGGVGMLAATDYCFATKFSSVKLSELAIGIGPFVVGPAVERKIGTSSYSAMTINAEKWFSSDWALNKGLYTEVFENNELMDSEIELFTQRISNYNPEAMKRLKKIFWKDTDHWDKLLEQRAEDSGILVLSDFTRNAISNFKNKQN